MIRRAEAVDAKSLAEVAEATFRETFAAMNTADQMDLHCRRSYGESIQIAEISNPGRVTLLSDTEGKLTGFAQLRWEAAPKCVSATRPGEIQRLYVVQHSHGKGVAQQLMSACLDEMRQRESDAVWLGVWEHNPRAIAFYAKFGFVEVGEHEFPLGGAPQRDIVMSKSLTTPQ
jgi:ribosomal protein S18 acetylase RimI-like enzyme